MIPYFIFNNVDSTDYLIINKLPSIFKASKDIEKIEVHGRDGFLTQDLGSYRSIIKSVECTIKNLDNIDYICNWLNGSGDIIFSNESNKIYKATIINQIEFKKIFVTYYSFIIQFECQPHKYSINNDLLTLTSAGVVTNIGNTISNPIVKIYGTGDITLNVGTQTINLKNVVNYVTIDTALMDCYKDNTLKNGDMYGDFPVLSVGSNTINWTGTVVKVEILPNWRWI